MKSQGAAVFAAARWNAASKLLSTGPVVSDRGGDRGTRPLGGEERRRRAGSGGGLKRAGRRWGVPRRSSRLIGWWMVSVG